MRGKVHHRYFYDLYRTKQGRRAPIMFLVLAVELVKMQIDPSLYLKIMAQYGAYAHLRYLPHPTWLASEKALEIFEWKYPRERKKYELTSDWKRALRGHNVEDIYQLVGDSANKVKLMMEAYPKVLTEPSAVLMMHQDLSPWFLAAYLPLRKQYAKPLRRLIDKDHDLYANMLLCLRYYNGNLGQWKQVKKIFRSVL